MRGRQLSSARDESWCFMLQYLLLRQRNPLNVSCHSRGVGSEAKRKHFDRLKSHKKCWLIVMLMYRCFKENINKFFCVWNS